MPTFIQNNQNIWHWILPLTWSVLFQAGGVYFILSIVIFSLWLALLLKNYQQQNYKKRHILIGFSIFTIYGFLWIWGTYPLSSSGIESPLTGFFVILWGWITFSVSMSLPFLCIHPILKYYADRAIVGSLLFALALVLAECGKSIFFALVTYGEQSLVGVHFTFSYTGYVLAEIPYLSLAASVGGVFVLTAIYGLLAIACAHMIRSRHYIVPVCIVVLLILLYLAPKPEYTINSNDKTLEVYAIQTNTPSTFTVNSTKLTDSHERISNQIEQIPDHKDVLVVLPEDSRYLTRHAERDFGKRTVIDSSRRDTQTGAYGQIDSVPFLQTQPYYKNLLTPEGEFLSYATQLILGLSGNSDVSHNFEQNRTYQKSTAVYPTDSQHGPLGVTLCSELYSPFIQSHMAGDSKILINLASHARMKGHWMLERQSKLMAQIRAIENARYLVRSGNMTPAYIINPYGSIVAITEAPEHDVTQTAIASQTVSLMDKRTIFSYAPGALPLITLLLYIIALAVPKKRNYI